MGVHDLWKLLAPCGHRVSIDTLTGTRLAVDVSIWLVQFLKAMRDPSGAPMKNGHIIGLLRRLLRLLYHGIQPIFVFDGPAPKLKKQTIAARRQQRAAYGESIKRMAEKILLTQLKMRSVQQLRKKLAEKAETNATTASEDSKSSKSKRRKKRSEPTENMSAAAGMDASTAIDVDAEEENQPPQPVVEPAADDGIEWEEEEKTSAQSQRQPHPPRSHIEVDVDEHKSTMDEDDTVDIDVPPDLPEGSSSEDEERPAIDEDQHFVLPADGQVDAQVLAKLPISLQYQVLQQQREHNRFHNFHKFSSVEHDPSAFSDMQMSGFLKSVKFSQSIDQLRKEMNLTVGPGGTPLGSSSTSGTAKDGSKLLMESARPASGAYVYYKSTAASANTPFSWKETIKTKKIRDEYQKRKKQIKYEQEGNKNEAELEEETSPEAKWLPPDAVEDKVEVIELTRGGPRDDDWLCLHCSGVNKNLSKLTSESAKRLCQTCGMKREEDEDEEMVVEKKSTTLTGIAPFRPALTSTLLSALPTRKDVKQRPALPKAASMTDQWQSPAERYGGASKQSSPPPSSTTVSTPSTAATSRPISYSLTSEANQPSPPKSIPLRTSSQLADEMPGLENAAGTIASVASSTTSSIAFSHSRTEVIDRGALTCSSCTFINLALAKVCQMCGSSLTSSATVSAPNSSTPNLTASFQEKAQRKLAKYVADQEEKIISSPVKPLSQIKPVEVDLTNESTAPATLDISFESTAAVVKDEIDDVFAAAFSQKPVVSNPKPIHSKPLATPSLPTVTHLQPQSVSHPPQLESKENEQIRLAMELSLKEMEQRTSKRGVGITFGSIHQSTSPPPSVTSKPDSTMVDDDIEWEEDEVQISSSPPVPPAPSTVRVQPPPPPTMYDDGGVADMDIDSDEDAPRPRKVKIEPPSSTNENVADNLKDTNMATPAITPPTQSIPSTTLSPLITAAPVATPKLVSKLPSISPRHVPSPKSIPIASPHFPQPTRVSLSHTTTVPSETVALTAIQPDDDAETRHDREQLQQLLGEIQEIDEEIEEAKMMNVIDEGDEEEEIKMDETTPTDLAAPSATSNDLILPPGVTLSTAAPTSSASTQAHNSFLASQREKRRLEEESANQSSHTDSPGQDATSSSRVSPSMVYEAFPAHMSASDAVALAQSFDHSYLEGEDAARTQANAIRGEAHVTEEMLTDSKELLQLFGIPYIESPGEAEAQCATLEMMKHVDGIITDDSDVFLFGAQQVYRHFFESKKFCEKYHMKEIQAKLGMDRRKLIHFALLLGSDYTPGVKGVGIVNATEILNAFPGEHGLEELRDWIYSSEPDREPSLPQYPDPCSLEERARLDGEYRLASFKYAHRNIKRNWGISRQYFPNQEVIEGYQHPNVDASTEQFTWSQPNWEGITKLCREKLQWSETEVDQQFRPIQQAMEQQRQLALDRFFAPDDTFAVIASERLNRAVKGLVHSTLTEEEMKHQAAVKLKKAAQAEKRKVAAAAKKKRKQQPQPAADDDETNPSSLFDDDFDLSIEDESILSAIESTATVFPSTLSPAASSSNTVPKRKPRSVKSASPKQALNVINDGDEDEVMITSSTVTKPKATMVSSTSSTAGPSSAAPILTVVTAVPPVQGGKARVVNPPPRPVSSFSTTAASTPPRPIERSPMVRTNRAPVLALWAACAACVSYGLPWPIGATIGHALMSVCMESAAKSLGLKSNKEIEEAAEASQSSWSLAAPSHPSQHIQVLGVDVEVQVLSDDEWGPALLHGRPQSANESVRYVSSKFGSRFDEVKEAFLALAHRCHARVIGHRFQPEEDFLRMSGAFALYEDFRPAVAAGVKGWGQIGTLNLDLLRNLP